MGYEVIVVEVQNFFNKFRSCVGFLEKSMVIADINLTPRFDCFGVQFLLCKKVYGPFVKKLLAMGSLNGKRNVFFTMRLVFLSIGSSF
jgi:hypothetical protein